MIQLSDAQIHSIRQQISRQVAFPEEMSTDFNEQQSRELLSEVAACRSQEDLESLATLMPRRRLNDLFGALLIVSAAEGEDVVIRLLNVLKQRITPSLAEVGWAFFQNHFPNDRLNRVLSTVVGELPDKSNEMPFIRAITQVADLPIIDDTLPARMAMKVNQQKGFDLGSYMVEMTILPDSPFASDFLANCFNECPDELIQDNAELYLHAIRKNIRDVQVKLVSNYLRADRLGEAWEPINLALLDLFGPPRSLQQQKLASLLGRSSDAKFWDFLNPDLVARFRQWSMLYELNKHIDDYDRKKLFYKLCSKAIREVSRWDDKTLVLIFDNFVLADSQEDEHMVVYYDMNTYQMLHDGNRFNVKLNRPSQPSITGRDAVLDQTKSNIVKLQLDAINLLYAKDFITSLVAPVKDMLQ